MKTALLLLMLASPAMAEEACFRDRDNPTWTLTETADGFIWRQGSKTQEMQSTGVGTNIPVVVAWDAEGEGHPYEYRDGKLIFDKSVYVPGCE